MRDWVKSGFLNSGTIDILHWIIFPCWGGGREAVLCVVGITALQPLDASSKLNLRGVTTKSVSNIVQIFPIALELCVLKPPAWELYHLEAKLCVRGCWGREGRPVKEISCILSCASGKWYYFLRLKKTREGRSDMGSREESRICFLKCSNPD